MASSSSSSTSKNPTISQQEIKLYHTMDRNIFARLVLNLGRDPGESIQVMALLLWLEKFCKHAKNSVYYIQPGPDTFISTLADEAVQCLNCIRSDEYPLSHIEGDNCAIPLIRKLTANELSLRFFHDHRLEVVRGIVRLVQDVCIRAFDDILQQVIVPMDIEQNLESLRFYGPLIRPLLPLYNYYNSVGDFGDHHNMGNNQQIFRPNTDGIGSGLFHGSLNNEMEELLNCIHITCFEEYNNNNNNREVAIDDRTIFLTFSKGYPISENEITDFFTRKLGDNLIEVVEMQEVPAGEQPLYARLVLRSASGLEQVLNGKPKVKFSINGKHVWSRKFVPKNPMSAM
ncbi:hypothetical protein PTKIN_Ptkin16aG0478500 [Pterospermum kingtungense]